MRCSLAHFAGAAVMVALAACSDGSPTAARSERPKPQPGHLTTLLECSVRVQPWQMRCVPARPAGAVRGDLIVGAPYVSLASRDVNWTGAWYFFEAAVTNLTHQKLGTTDGTTLDPTGVRVFFHSGPTVTGGSGSISVSPDGYATFTASNQPYYQYNTILADSAQSSFKTWTLHIPQTVTTFAFTVYVSAPVQFPNGWITVTPNDFSLGASSTQQLGAVSHTAGGAVAGGATFNWATGNASVATVSASGLVTAVAAGQTDITVTDNSGTGRSGTAHVTVP